MVNRGIAPPDPTTDVGRMREILGDTSWVELNPPEPGYGDYENFSDAELQALLDLADGSLFLAVAFAFAKLAAASTGESLSFQSDDLKVDLSKRTGGLWDTVRFWFNLWEREQEKEAVEYHNFVPFRGGCNRRGPEYAWGDRVWRQHW